MNVKKTTTMIFKTKNYSNAKHPAGNGKKLGHYQLRKTLKHSLRIPSKEIKTTEWIEADSHRNLLWINGQLRRMDDVPLAERQQLVEQIMATASEDVLGAEELAAARNSRTKYKDKLKRAIKNEEYPQAKAGLEAAYNVQGVADIQNLIAPLESSEMKRKAQKITMVRQFLELHNQIEQANKPKVQQNRAVIQESFFKFPSRNEVENITPEEFIGHIQGFYSKCFPDNPILAIAFHGDESTKGNHYDDHPHIITSMKNRKTGEYDLIQQQRKLVNSWIKKNYPDKKPLPLKMNHDQSKLFGGYFQEIFYAYTNAKLLKNKPIEAKIKEKTQENNEWNRELDLEASKPKSERTYSLYRKMLEENSTLKYEIENLTYEKDKLIIEKDTLTLEKEKIVDGIRQAAQKEQAIMISLNKTKENYFNLRDDLIAEQQRQKILKQVIEQDEEKSGRLYSEIQHMTRQVEDLDKHMKQANSRLQEMQNTIMREFTSLVENLTGFIQAAFDKIGQNKAKYSRGVAENYERIYDSDLTSDMSITAEALKMIDEVEDKTDSTGYITNKIKRKLLRP